MKPEKIPYRDEVIVLEPSELTFALKNAWLVPVIPFLSFLLVGLVVKNISKRAAGVVATLAVFASAAVAVMVAHDYYQLVSDHSAIVPLQFEWLRYQDHLVVSLGVLVDPISVLLMVVVTIVSALIHLYSNGYMHGDPGFGRFFTYLNLFTFSMLGLVTAPNILQMFICWELVGTSSFLLIGFYYTKPSAVAASKKAFIVTRFADLGFLIGILVLAYFGMSSFGSLQLDPAPGCGAALGPFDFLFLNNPDVLTAFAGVGPVFMGVSLLTWASLLVFMGCAGKSAMFPLHIWLPDAMEGPTPVSALIHAATMVVAGVYLVARLFPVFAASGQALLVVAVVGAFTCLFAAIIGCTQDDVKRVLAFSTLSQLGYMMFALGVATMEHPLGYTASMFHLGTHAFFKALLFLGAGAIIHAVHSNSIWDMGGLWKKLPITHGTFLVATLALAGLFPFSGFFSKDEILAAALHNHHTLIFSVGVLVAGLTAFYMFRVYFVMFWGAPRSEHAGHAHEAPAVMWIPLVLLAIPTVLAGWIPIGEFVSIGHLPEHHGVDWTVAIPASLAGLIGIALAAWFYLGSTQRAESAARALGRVHIWIKQKFYIDEIYLFITHKIIFRFVAFPIAWFDRHIVDGGVDLSGLITRTTGRTLRVLQTGQVQTYGMGLVVGVLFVALFILTAWI